MNVGVSLINSNLCILQQQIIRSIDLLNQSSKCQRLIHSLDNFNFLLYFNFWFACCCTFSFEGGRSCKLAQLWIIFLLYYGFFRFFVGCWRGSRYFFWSLRLLSLENVCFGDGIIVAFWLFFRKYHLSGFFLFASEFVLNEIE